MTACALAAAVHATAGELGRQLDGRAFRGLHHSGAEKQFYLAPRGNGARTYICLTVFDRRELAGARAHVFRRSVSGAEAAAPPLPDVDREDRRSRRSTSRRDSTRTSQRCSWARTRINSVSLVNYATREITCKIVYYGPGRSGKTTNLHYIYGQVPDDRKGKMVSLATQTDRTLFFDFLPLDLGTISGFTTKFQLYTVPGQVYYQTTRKLVLQGADGVVFVADSQSRQLAREHRELSGPPREPRRSGLDARTVPLVIQYNKQDLPSELILELDRPLGRAQL